MYNLYPCINMFTGIQCITDEDKTNLQTFKEVYAGKNNTQCSFPFIFENKIHEACIRRTDSVSWCSTKKTETATDDIGQHWGYCPKLGSSYECPVQEGKQRTNSLQ